MLVLASSQTIGWSSGRVCTSHQRIRTIKTTMISPLWSRWTTWTTPSRNNNTCWTSLRTMSLKSLTKISISSSRKRARLSLRSKSYKMLKSASAMLIQNPRSQPRTKTKITLMCFQSFRKSRKLTHSRHLGSKNAKSQSKTWCITPSLTRMNCHQWSSYPNHWRRKSPPSQA